MIETDKLTALYEQMATFVQHNGISPSIREVADMLGIDSTSHAKLYIDRMAEYGWLTYKPGKARTIRLLKATGDLPKAAPTRAKGECDVPGCGQPIWAGPAGMNFALKKCHMHQIMQWTADEIGKPHPARKKSSEAIALVDLTKRPAGRWRKFIVIDHSSDAVIRFNVPLSDIARLGTVADAERLLPGYRATGHTVIVLEKEEQS